MTRLWLYYQLKPVIPTRVRFALRRFLAQRLRVHSRSVWPILETSGQPPSTWTGWPGKRPFAFILTHDVEGPKGLARCEALMELERELGFRSSFNFIPEGAYRVAPELRRRLSENGFEVGVHDHRHDGKLYRSARRFQEGARTINRTLREWGAVGFRSGFMHHNLDWIGDLDIAYDASTFDSDPFEPQPDGTGTIFPFWVPRRGSGRPFLELPYTLPQDSTLFLFLEETSIEVWKRKAAWVAAHGGMVLLNTHPDYMTFGGDCRAVDEYPVELYREFLLHMKATYGDQPWRGVPRELAQQLSPSPVASTTDPVAATADEAAPIVRPPVRPSNVCLVGALFYDSDNRTMRYAETLLRQGHSVDVIAVRRPGEARHAVVDGVNVYRVQVRERNERGKFSYLWRLGSFLITSGLFLSWMQLRRRYRFVHVHSIPDFEVFAALVPKLTGAKVLLDIYDVTPEFYLSKFKATKDHFAYRALIWVERISCAFADHVISANHLWQKLLTSRSVPEGKATPFINYVDTRLFYPRKRTRTDDRVIVVYPGVLNWHQGVDIAVQAFRRFKDEVPTAEFHIYGDGNEKDRLLRMIGELGLEGAVLIKAVVPLREIPQIMADADLGVVAKRNDVFGNEAYSTKIMEYMSQGLPVVVARTAIDDYYFTPEVVEFFAPGDPADMARAMVRLWRDPARRESLARNALCYVEVHGWERKQHDYLDIVDHFLDR